MNIYEEEIKKYLIKEIDEYKILDSDGFEVAWRSPYNIKFSVKKAKSSAMRLVMNLEAIIRYIDDIDDLRAQIRLLTEKLSKANMKIAKLANQNDNSKIGDFLE